MKPSARYPCWQRVQRYPDDGAERPADKNRDWRIRSLDGDPAKPFLNGGKDSYWDHIDWVIDRAAERGIYVGLADTTLEAESASGADEL